MPVERDGLVACLVKYEEIFKYPHCNCLSSTNPVEFLMFLVVDKVMEIPICSIRIYHWHLCNYSDRAMALGTNQPTTQISTRDISWPVKAAGA